MNPFFSTPIPPDIVSISTGPEHTFQKCVVQYILLEDSNSTVSVQSQPAIFSDKMSDFPIPKLEPSILNLVGWSIGPLFGMHLVISGSLPTLSKSLLTLRKFKLNFRLFFILLTLFLYDSELSSSRSIVSWVESFPNENRSCMERESFLLKLDIVPRFSLLSLLSLSLSKFLDLLWATGEAIRFLRRWNADCGRTSSGVLDIWDSTGSRSPGALCFDI